MCHIIMCVNYSYCVIVLCDRNLIASTLYTKDPGSIIKCAFLNSNNIQFILAHPSTPPPPNKAIWHKQQINPELQSGQIHEK